MPHVDKMYEADKLSCSPNKAILCHRFGILLAAAWIYTKFIFILFHHYSCKLTASRWILSRYHPKTGNCGGGGGQIHVSPVCLYNENVFVKMLLVAGLVTYIWILKVTMYWLQILEGAKLLNAFKRRACILEVLNLGIISRYWEWLTFRQLDSSRRNHYSFFHRSPVSVCACLK